MSDGPYAQKKSPSHMFYSDVNLRTSMVFLPLSHEQIVLRDRMIHALLNPFVRIGQPLDDLKNEALDLFLTHIVEKCNEYGIFLSCIGNSVYGPSGFLEDVIQVLRDRYSTNEEILAKLEECI